tara:strand:- start:5653 stop:6744 length:1092 start_codon:yes stop_codon:yes gene_type:complete
LAKIFICYRRENGYFVDSFKQHLSAYIPPEDIFVDIHHIPVAERFDRYVENILKQCSHCLVIMGPNWAQISDSDGNRKLDNPNDFVRQEISTALKNGIPILPILFDSAVMPDADDLPADLRSIVFQNSLRVEREYIEAGVARLSNDIGLSKPRLHTELEGRGTSSKRERSFFGLKIAFSLLVVGAISVCIGWLYFDLGLFDRTLELKKETAPSSQPDSYQTATPSPNFSARTKKEARQETIPIPLPRADPSPSLTNANSAIGNDCFDIKLSNEQMTRFKAIARYERAKFGETPFEAKDFPVAALLLKTIAARGIPYDDNSNEVFLANEFQNISVLCVGPLKLWAKVQYDGKVGYLPSKVLGIE